MATKADVDAVRHEAEIGRIKQSEQLRKVDAWISFVAAKGLGLGGLIVGGLEMLVPDVLALTLSQPSWIAACGLALLTGKNLIKIISAAGDIVGGKK